MNEQLLGLHQKLEPWPEQQTSLTESIRGLEVELSTIDSVCTPLANDHGLVAQVSVIEHLSKVLEETFCQDKGTFKPMRHPAPMQALDAATELLHKNLATCIITSRSKLSHAVSL